MGPRFPIRKRAQIMKIDIFIRIIGRARNGRVTVKVKAVAYPGRLGLVTHVRERNGSALGDAVVF